MVNVAQGFSFLINSVVRHFNDARHNNIMTFRAREQGVPTYFQWKAKRFSKAVSISPLCSESCLNLSVSFCGTFIEIMQGKKKVIMAFTLLNVILCNRVEMSQGHRMLESEECYH